MSSIPEVLLKLTPQKRALLASKLPPLSFAQQRMWFLDYYQPANSYYCIRAAVQLTGPLNIAALERSFTECLRRHHVLRTNFAMLEDRLVQFLNPATPCTVPLIDLSSLSPDRRLPVARQLADEEVQRPFDLANDQLVRLSLLRLGSDDHVLLMTMHHIISDAWSSGILIQELGVLYDAYSQGRQSPLPELKIQYADYSIWQRNWFQGEVLENELAHWQRQLSGAPPVLDLPADRPRPSVQTYQGEHLTIRLPQALTEQIKTLGQAETVTSFMLLLTAFQIFLSRYTGLEDICVGTPIAGRNRVETEGLIGLFVNTLVIRTELSSEQTFREVLANVRDRAFEAFAHQDVPFEKLVEVLQPERHLGRTPLFQVMFSLQNATAEAPRMHELQLDFWKHDTSMSQFDLMLTIVEADRLQFTIEYSTDLFEESTIVRMFGHFQNLLEGIVQAPDKQVGRLPLLNKAEREQALARWNDTAADYPRDACIHTLFEQQVARTAEAVAVIDGGEQLTYRELNERANRLAHHLQNCGVGPDVLVGICLERSIDMIVALLGILKAGGAYVPLDPSYPLPRLSAMIEDSRVPILIASEQTLDILPAHWGQTICIDTDWTMIAGESPENPTTDTVAGNLAYVIYTSGSTGRPKGVAIPQRAVNRLVINSNYVQLGPDDVVAQVSNSSFDAATFEIWGALLNGARLVILERDATLTPRELAEQIRQNRISTMFLTTALFNQIAREAPEAFEQMRNLLFGGEQADPKSVAAVLEHGGPERLLHVYGPTETTTFASWCEIKHLAPEAQTVPIGKPISNTQLYVLDKYFEPVPPGVSGELYIGGDGLARGYLNTPQLTVEKFVPNPFSTSGGEFLYRTGDVARQLVNGDIEFVGRIDNQVKMRGFRIELGEIEAVLGQLPDVSQCVVLIHTSAQGDKRLVAYVVPGKNGEPPVSELRRYLEERLPEYMVPFWYVFLEQLPLTLNGKVARHELPEPDTSQGMDHQEYLAPRSATEEILTGIWAEILSVGRVSVTDDFFELGGHSLLATQLISRVREAFGIELPLRQLFEFPTVAGLAREIEQLNRLEFGLEAPPIQPVGRDIDIPLSFAQQRLWFLDQLQPDSAIYNVGIALRLRGSLDVGLLEKTITEVVRRHEVLRTTFAVSGDAPVQIISEARPLRLVTVDLSELPANDKEQEAKRLVEAENQEPFNLARGPLLRVGLLRLDESDHVLPVTVHHIISDGWSLDVLVHEVATLFAAFRNGTDPQLPELVVQYADFAVWQRAWLRNEVLDQQLDYWRRQLAGAPPILELPTDKPRPPVQSFRGAHESVRLDEPLAERLRELSRREGVTLFMTLLAGWQMLLARFTGQDDIVVGTPIAGRNRLETEGLIGFFVNTLVLRTNLGGNPSFREALKLVREVMLGAYAHQDLPFEKLVEELQPERSLSHTPVFQVAISFHNAPQESLELGDLEISGMESENLTAKFDLTLTISESSKEIASALVYNSDLFNDATIKRLLAQYAQLLESVVNDAELKLSELPLLTGNERHQLVTKFNDTRVDFPSVSAVHHLFEEQVRAHGEEVAVVAGAEELSYEELNKRANQLAHYLRKQGVGAEQIVGIYLERSIEMVIGILGVVKSGGAYLPLDVSYPKKRISHLLEEQVSVLLTRRKLLSELSVAD
ncbi:MAG TPA: amino acid adenylation domain-containing protein, partial [Pyrinomonadaceae bacterium]